MRSREKQSTYSIFLTVFAWGTAWGIFETTAGYLLHLLPINIGWLIWYPVACFFMANAYRRTRRITSVFFVGLLAAFIKMFNFLLPVSIDKVINPAVSILFEALTMGAVIFAVRELFGPARRNPFVKGLAALSMNVGWRALYSLYLLYLVPASIRDVSVISNIGNFIRFFVTQNLIASLVLFLGYQYKNYIFKPVIVLEQKAKGSQNLNPILKAGIIVLMLGVNITLELLL